MLPVSSDRAHPIQALASTLNEGVKLKSTKFVAHDESPRFQSPQQHAGAALGHSSRVDTKDTPSAHRALENSSSSSNTRNADFTSGGLLFIHAIAAVNARITRPMKTGHEAHREAVLLRARVSRFLPKHDSVLARSLSEPTS